MVRIVTIDQKMVSKMSENFMEYEFYSL